MSNISKIKQRTILQYLVLVAAVIFSGWVIRYKENKQTTINAEKQRIESKSLNPGISVSTNKASGYPNVKHLSDNAWNKYKKQLLSKRSDGQLFKGEGEINSKKVTVELILNSDGSLTGRYHHINGTKLDLNGYIDPSDGTLNIHLGHASDKTLSTWTLKPTESDIKNGIYKYVGKWGKKGLSSNLTLLLNT